MTETPSDPPVEPGASARIQPGEELHALPASALTLWRIVAVATGALVLAATLVFMIALAVIDRGGPSSASVLAVAAGAAAAVLTLGLVAAQVRYRRWRYGIDEVGVRAAWGVLVHSTAVVPRNRVQTVTTEDGPLDRLFDLTTLTVHTAGAHAPNLVIPHLDRSTVAWLRDELTHQGQHSSLPASGGPEPTT